MLKSRLLTMFQIFCDSGCPCIIMNTNKMYRFQYFCRQRL